MADLSELHLFSAEEHGCCITKSIDLCLRFTIWTLLGHTRRQQIHPSVPGVCQDKSPMFKAIREPVVEALGSQTNCESWTGLSLDLLCCILQDVLLQTEQYLRAAKVKLGQPGQLRMAILHRFLQLKGKLAVKQTLHGCCISSTFISDRCAMIDKAFTDFTVKELPGGPTARDRECARVVIGDLFPGCIGFVDGFTVPISRPGTDSLRRQFWCPHHCMFGVNYLAFSSVDGRLLEVVEMGPGGSYGERLAAVDATRAMQATGHLMSGEYFMGDAIFNGLRGPVRGIGTVPRLSATAGGLLPIAAQFDSLNRQQQEVLRGATAFLVVEALQLRVLTHLRVVVENTIAQVKSFSSHLKQAESQTNYCVGQRNSLHACVVFAAGMVAARQRYDPTSLPRSQPAALAAAYHGSILALVGDAVHIIGGHARTQRRNKFVEAMHAKYARRRDFTAVQDLALLLYPAASSEDDYADVATRLADIISDRLKYSHVARQMKLEGYAHAKRSIVRAGRPSATSSGSTRVSSSSASATRAPKRRIVHSSLLRTPSSYAWTILGVAFPQMTPGSVWQPLDQRPRRQRRGQITIASNYLIVMEPTRFASEFQGDPGAWTAWWYHRDTGDECCIERVQQRMDTDPVKVRIHEYSIINTCDRPHFAANCRLLNMSEPEEELQEAFEDDSQLSVFRDECLRHDYGSL